MPPCNLTWMNLTTETTVGSQLVTAKPKYIEGTISKFLFGRYMFDHQ